MQSPGASGIMPARDSFDTISLTHHSSHPSPGTLRWGFLTLGLVLGALLAWPLLSGDAQGQVNLLVALALLAVLPLLMLVFTLFALLRRRERWMSRIGSRLPLLPASWRRQLRQWRITGGGFWWLFYAGQWMALGFSLGALSAYGLLLLFTDLHFVWRSTLLSATDLAPLLKMMALPWRFWEAAQPSLELLLQTRASRLQTPDASAPLERWWRFLLAAQICYALIPRLLLAAWAGRHLQRHNRATATTDEPPATEDPNRLAETTRDWPADARWIDSAFLPGEIAALLPQTPQPLTRTLPDGGLVVTVRSWEPPLGELADRLQGHRGLILPLDWEGSELRPLRPEHRDEWRRFAATLPGWRILLWGPGHA